MSNLDLTIQTFSQSDQPAAAAFCKAIFKEMGWNPDDSDGLDIIIEYFHIPEHGQFWVVKDEEGKIVGTAGLKFLDSSTALVKRFYLAPHLRGSGYAETLMDFLQAWAKEQGFSKLVLDTNTSNHRAIGFYQKYGLSPFQPKPHPDWPESSMPNYYYFECLLS